MLVRVDQEAAQKLNLQKIPKFLDFFAGSARILEIGSGRGDFLVMAKERGMAAEGLEPHGPTRKKARLRGVTVHDGRALPFMKKHARRYDAFFLSNVIEHFHLAEARRFLALLPKGAKVAVTTPNPECLEVMMKDFWSDPEHTRPYAPRVLQELFDEAGIAVIKMLADEDSRPQGPLRSLARAMRTRFIGPYFGPAELYVLGAKSRH